MRPARPRTFPRISRPVLAAALGILAQTTWGVSADGLSLKLSGKGWYEFGRVMHSSDTLVGQYNYNGNFVHRPGAQFTVLADMGEHWDGAMGLGGYETQDPQGSVFNSTQRKIETGFKVYITQADFAYTLGAKEAPLLKGTFGLFPFVYNPDVRNLGEYLLRGPVYPGILMSNFESNQIDPSIANTLGLNLKSVLGGFTQDLILKSETDLPPQFDFSLAYLAQYQVKGLFTFGVGVNFYRLIPMKPALTNLTDPAFMKDNRSVLSVRHPYQQKYIYVPTDTVAFNADGTLKPNAAGRDSVNGTFTKLDDTTYIWAGRDTTLLSHRGTKLMGRFSFDPKFLFYGGGSGPFGANDWKIYGEAAVIGTKNYPGVYEKIGERIPIMLGFNIPTLGLLDDCALEVEWYGAKFRDDYYKLVKETSPIPVSNHSQEYDRKADSLGRLESDTTIAFSSVDVEHMTKDDWKWSLYMSKTLRKYVKVSLQVANDHYRPWEDSPSGATTRYEGAFTELRDYYAMMKIGFTF
ncbi:MAG: hypothetical protein JWO30_4649 [Fibrobacteres bacterium]|nr:hypothetical protein [Fibrobacterota bacterium]